MGGRGVAILVFCLLAAAPLRAQPELVLTDEHTVVSLTPYLALLRDEDRALRIEDVTGAYAGRFAPADAARTNLGYTRAAYWGRLRVRNAATARRRWHLVVDEHDLSRIELYRVTPEGAYRAAYTGTSVARPVGIVPDLFHTFPLDVPPGQGETLYLRVTAEDAMLLPLWLWTPEALQERSRNEWFIVGLFVGLLGTMCVYGTLLFLMLGDRLYLYFALFAGTLAVLELIQDGVQSYVQPGLNPVSHALVPGLVMLAAVVLLLFTRAFLHWPAPGTRSATLFRAGLGVLILWGLLGLLLGYYTAMVGNNVLLLGVMAACLTGGVQAWRREQPAGRMYLLSWSPLMLWMLYFLFSRAGLIPHWPWMDYGCQITVSLLMLGFAWSLAARVRHIEKDREAARQEAIDRQQEALQLQDELNVTLQQHTEQLEREVAERTAELQASNARWQLLFEHNPLPAVLLVEGRAMLVNRAGLTLMRAPSIEAVRGHSVTAVIDPDYLRTHRERMEQLARGHMPEPVRYRLRRLDGEPFWAEVSSMSIEYKGKPAVLAVIRDVTEAERLEAERRRITEELEAKNRELERFAHTVSHDLKSPLFTIKGFAGVVREELESGKVDDALEDLERIEKAAAQMEQLLEGLLALSRAGRQVSTPESVPLDALATEAIDLLAGSITGRGVEVCVGPMPSVKVDRLRMRQVFQNLIENAIKFMGDQPAPRIEITAEERTGAVLCRIRDNGPGIDPAHREHIFELFTRLDTGQDGSGIGLPLVRRIIEAHGGRIWVESGPDGTGSTFCFTLPKG